MRSSDAPDGHTPRTPLWDALLRPAAPPEPRRVPRVAKTSVSVRNLYSEITSTNPSRPISHTDASVHDDWVMDAALARQNLAKWLRNSLGGVSNKFFTAHEQEELLQHIAALQDEVTRLTSLNDKQSKAILGMLAQAQKDSKRLGKKDWLLAGIGAGTALVVTGAVPPLFMLHLAVRVIHVLGKWLTS